MNTGNFKSWCKRHQIALSAAFTVVPLIIGLYFERDNIKQLGIPLSFNDFVQALGQFGTVGAFLIGYTQLKKAKHQEIQQAEKERRLLFTNAVQAKINNIDVQAHKLNVNRAEAEAFCKTLESLAYLGKDLLRLLVEVGEGAEKIVLEDRWSEVFGGSVCPHLNKVSIFDLVGNGIHPDHVTAAQFYAADCKANRDTADVFPEYHFTLDVLRYMFPHMHTKDKEVLYIYHPIYIMFKEVFFEQIFADVGEDPRISHSMYLSQMPVVAALEKYFHGRDAAF